MTTVTERLKISEATRPVAVHIADGKIWVTLQDGRTIANPLAWHPWLAGASPAAAAHVELDALSVYWPDLDEGLDIEGMLRGIHSEGTGCPHAS